MGIRRLRRAAGGGNVSAPTNDKPANSRPERRGVVTARGDADAEMSESDSWALWGDDANNGNGNGGDHQSAAASSKIMSLSEKLRRQELMEQELQQRQRQRQQQQRGRGPIMDSDHSAISGNDSNNNGSGSSSRRGGGGGGESVESGWSWAESSSRGSSILRGNGMRKMGIRGNGNDNDANNKLAVLLKKMGKRNNIMKLAHQAFGEEGKMKEKIASVVNCTKTRAKEAVAGENESNKGGEDSMTARRQRHEPRHAIKMAKALMAALVVFAGVFRLGRNGGHRLGGLEDENDFSRMTFDNGGGGDSSNKNSMNSVSMNDQFLRGHLPSDNGGEGLPITGGRVSSSAAGRGLPSPSYRNSDSNRQNSNNINRINNDDNVIIVHQAIFPPHLSHLSNLTSPYDSRVETPYFWDVHFSGETVAESVFGRCHGLAQAAEFGMRQPDYNEDKLELFQLDKTSYVNVELTTPQGITRASNLNLASSHVSDVIISPHFHSVTSQIFAPSSPGRMFALFRHPVDRALSMYYYLAKASWDPHYNPALKTMTIEEYAKSRYVENNWLTRFLVDKPGGKLTHADMLLAKKIIKFKCLVGLYDDIETSLGRFQRYFGWNADDAPERRARVVQCRSLAVLRGDKNLLGHPISIKEEGYRHRYGTFSGTADNNSRTAVRAGSLAWNAIVRMNRFDMELYEYAKKIYGVQGEQIFDVVGHEVPVDGGAGAGRSAGNGMGDESGGERETDGARMGGKSIAMEAFEDESSSGSGKSMGDLVFGDSTGLQSGGKSMELDGAGDESMADSAVIEDVYSGNMADEAEDESDLEEEEDESTILDMPIDAETHKYCQIIHILGVEGVGHHGFAPIINTLFEHQIDPSTGIHYERLTQDHSLVHRAFYGQRNRGRPIDDPFLVKKMIRRACPNDGAKHVLLLGASFPSGNANGEQFRASRQGGEWAEMGMEEMAKSESALNHPMNLRLFAKAYSPYADIKFVVLHRPFMETIASHSGFDGGPEKHINIISGYLLLIRRFLDDLPLDSHGNSRWTLICMQQLSTRYYKGDTDRLTSARQAVVSNLATFLKWPQEACDDCFDQWRDSERLDPEAQLYNRGVAQGQPDILDKLDAKVVALDGIWPPPQGGNGAGEQCGQLIVDGALYSHTMVDVAKFDSDAAGQDELEAGEMPMSDAKMFAALDGI